MRPILENPAIAKIGQNLKYDMIVLRNVGVRLAGAAFDTMVASYLLDAGERNHNLDDLAERYLDHTTIKIGELIGKGKNQKRMDEVPVAQIGPYAAEDADVPLRLQPLLEARLDETGSTDAQRDRRSAADRRAGRHGIRRRPRRSASGWPSSATATASGSSELESEIEELAGHPLNIALAQAAGRRCCSRS